MKNAKVLNFERDYDNSLKGLRFYKQSLTLYIWKSKTGD